MQIACQLYISPVLIVHTLHSLKGGSPLAKTFARLPDDSSSIPSMHSLTKPTRCPAR